MYHQSTARWLLLAAFLLPLLSRPALAAEPPAEDVLLDAVLTVTPPAAAGLCMRIGAGQLTVTVQRVQGAPVEPRPARFSLSGLMFDPEAQITMPVTDRPSTTTTQLAGSPRYCWDVSIDAPETASMPNAQRGDYVQAIAVTITHRPS